MGGLHDWMRDLAAYNKHAAGRDGLDTLTGEVATNGHTALLPDQFIAFLADPILRESVPTCTSCFWENSLPAAASPIRDGAQLVRFLNDQQGCLFWYLHLLPHGDHEIVCGAYAYDEQTIAPDHAAADLILVADSFDEFIARFWIENLAWYEVVGRKRPDQELSPPVRAYVQQLAAETPEAG